MVFEWAKYFLEGGFDTLLVGEKSGLTPCGEAKHIRNTTKPKNFATVLLTFVEPKINFPRCLLPASTA